MSSKDNSAEIQRFERRYAAEPGSLVFARLADACRKAGQLDRALEVVEEGLAKHPDYLSAHLVHARILRRLDRLETAAEALERALGLDSQNLVALRARAELALDVGDAATAARSYERILEIEPFDLAVRDALRDVRASIETEPPPEPAPAVEVEPPPELAPAVDVEPEAKPDEPAPSGASKAWLASLDESPLVLPPVAAAAEDEPAEDGEVVEEAVQAEPEPVAHEEAVQADPEPVAIEEAGRESPAEPEPSHQLMTATMAELYLKQGLYEEAISVYERLLESSPGDFRLIEKLKAARLLSERGPAIKKRLQQSGTRPPDPREEMPRPEPAHEKAPERDASPEEDVAPPEEREPAPLPADAPEARHRTIRAYLESLLDAPGPREGGMDPGASPRFEAWLVEQDDERQGE